MHGLEVEEVIDRAKDFENVVVGEIVAIRPHPNADKLRLADVITTPNGKPQEIVCGAPNIEVGQKAPVALLGAKLPNGLTIEKRAIRGVESNGMLCAADELGLGKDHSGILILDASMKVGTPFAAAMGFDGVALDITLPANRADLMSIRGLAREIAAMLNTTATLPVVKLTENKTLASKSVAVSVSLPKLTPVYTARVIRGVKVQSSPTLIQNYLRQAGMRPINAIVDATNAVMLEYGQPLHAFDAAKVKGKIVVRNAQAGESLVTLDGQNRKLDPTMLIIADSTGPIALAGVMGGRDTEVSDTTTDVILEAAIFDPVSIRKTSRKLGLVSEASTRFEKGLWASLPTEASSAAAAMIVDMCGGTVEKGAVTAGTTKSKPVVVTFDPHYVTERLGMTIPASKVRTILTKLGFKVTGGKTWKLTVPEWRLDVSLPEDLVDEIGRMVGYEKLPPSFPQVNSIPQPLPRSVILKEKVRDIMIGLGFTEVITHSYYGEGEKNIVGGDHIAIANPLDKTQQYLRRSLLPAIKNILEAAADAGDDAKVFEISRVFLPAKDVEKMQAWKLSIGLAQKASAGYVSGWKLLGAVQSLTQDVGGDISMIQPPVEIDYKSRHLEYIEFDLSSLFDIRVKKTFQPQSEFPTSARDISFWAPTSLSYEKIRTAISRAATDVRIGVQDVFDKEGKRSYTIRLTLGANDRTLTKNEIDTKIADVTKALKDLGATIR